MACASDNEDPAIWAIHLRKKKITQLCRIKML